MKKIISFLLVFGCCIAVWADFQVIGMTENNKMFFKSGEEAVFIFQIRKDGKEHDGFLKVKVAGDDGNISEKIYPVSAGKPLKINAGLKQPGFIMTEAVLVNEAGKEIRTADAAKKRIAFGLGCGFDAEKLRQGKAEPADYRKFWERARQELAAVPMKVLEKKLIHSTQYCNIYDIKIAAPGKRPASGYMTVPKDAAPKSMVVRFYFDGYGVNRIEPIETRYSIAFVINAHGIENGKDNAYYRELRRGELKNYAFKASENNSPDTCYFKNMILRDLRAVEYGMSLPEWNGKELEVNGGSQGGFQAMAMAALVPQVTKCTIGVPWMCDAGGVLVKRVRGWRPNLLPGINYYDTVNFARYVKCPVVISAGLSDWTCPPSGVMVLYNNLQGKKELKFLQGLNHGYYVGFKRAEAPVFKFSSGKK